MTDSPTVFSNASLAGERFPDTSFRDATIDGCDVDGLRIDGLLVTDLLRVYREHLRKESAR